MTPTQAAKEIGCSPQYVRDLIRARVIYATPKQNKFPNRDGTFGFTYEITSHEVEKAKKLPSRSTRGKRRAS